jgi:hypothetical protein
MLLEQIKNSLQTADVKTLAYKLGYSNTNVFEKTLKKFTGSPTILQWIENGHYDFVNNGETFLKKITNILGFDNAILQKELDYITLYKEEEQKFKSSYIFIDTNFKRESEPMGALTICEHFRRISLYKVEKFLFKSTNEILELLKIDIKKHYKKNQEGLNIWGKIVSYQLHLLGEIYLFDTNGELKIDQIPVIESKAEIRI